MTNFDLFGGLDAQQISDDPYTIPDDAHECVIESAKFTESRTGKPALQIVYKLTGGIAAGQTVMDWFNVGPIPFPEGSQEYQQELRFRSFLKALLLSLGVPESKMSGNFDPADLIGIVGVVKTKKVKDNYRVQNFTLESDGGTSSNGAGVSPSGSSPSGNIFATS